MMMEVRASRPYLSRKIEYMHNNNNNNTIFSFDFSSFTFLLFHFYYISLVSETLGCT